MILGADAVMDGINEVNTLKKQGEPSESWTMRTLFKASSSWGSILERMLQGRAY
jgi:hypothetical protein